MRAAARGRRTLMIAVCVAVPAVAAALAPAAVLADPPPDPVLPVPPPPSAGLVPPLAAIGSAMAQAGSEPAGPLGLPDLSGQMAELLLGQAAAPQPPGADPAGVPLFNAFSPLYLLPQNVEPAAPGEGELAPGIGPDGDDPGTGRIAFLRRLYEMYQAGDLRGALLGQAPQEQPPQPQPPAS